MLTLTMSTPRLLLGHTLAVIAGMVNTQPGRDACTNAVEEDSIWQFPNQEVHLTDVSRPH